VGNNSSLAPNASTSDAFPAVAYTNKMASDALNPKLADLSQFMEMAGIGTDFDASGYYDVPQSSVPVTSSFEGNPVVVLAAEGAIAARERVGSSDSYVYSSLHYASFGVVMGSENINHFRRKTASSESQDYFLDFWSWVPLFQGRR